MISVKTEIGLGQAIAICMPVTLLWPGFEPFFACFAGLKKTYFACWTLPLKISEAFQQITSVVTTTTTVLVLIFDYFIFYLYLVSIGCGGSSSENCTYVEVSKVHLQTIYVFKANLTKKGRLRDFFHLTVLSD